jgi:hypothetical protein
MVCGKRDCRNDYKTPRATTVATDVVGYGRTMGQNDERRPETLKETSDVCCGHLESERN